MIQPNTPARRFSSRRDFLRQCAWQSPLACYLGSTAAQAAVTCPPETPGGIPQSGAPLTPIGEIRRSNDGILRATIVVEDELRSLWMPLVNTRSAPGFRVPGCREKQAMRYFAGGPTGEKRVWPVTKGVPGPAPTLRARLGDLVQITLLNHVDVKNFPNTLDLAEHGKSTGCDSSSTLAGDEGRRRRAEVYPSGDQMPNCFHGSSSANLHFHGFHISPEGIQDNVLVQVRPSPRDPQTNLPIVTEAAVKRAFQELFAAAALGKFPKKWEDLPLSFRRLQEQWIKAYDREIPAAKLWQANQHAISQGLWPPFFVGAYANSFRIVEQGKSPAQGAPPAKAAQSPGTHWYHSHKHGSTALNSFNGMAGAFIVEGDYDDQLRKFYGGKLEEKILMLQQFSPALNLLNAPPPNGTRDVTTFDPNVFVNGLPKPVLEMRPNQVQFWRILNACGQQTIRFEDILTPATADAPGAPGGFRWRQTAQDGIQFHWNNYHRPANNNPQLTFSPANRADLLIQAPSKPGRYELRVRYFPFPGGRRSTDLLTIEVKGDPIPDSPGFPEQQSDFPVLPAFLADIDPKPIRLRRDVTFGTQTYRGDGKPASGIIGRGDAPASRPSKHTIDDAQFQSDLINQVMVEGTAEEWTLWNTTEIPQLPAPGGAPARDPQGRVIPVGEFAHPFHIHVNPFQVTEIFDPMTMDKPLTFDKDPIWYDTIGIPPAYNYLPDGKTPRTDPSGKQIYVPGYVKIRSRFEDFTGMFVFHCHILAHEDRGMMQLVQIVPGRTAAGHHH